jgi:hypothetical protein
VRCECAAPQAVESNIRPAGAVAGGVGSRVLVSCSSVVMSATDVAKAGALGGWVLGPGVIVFAIWWVSFHRASRLLTFGRFSLFEILSLSSPRYAF